MYLILSFWILFGPATAIHLSSEIVQRNLQDVLPHYTTASISAEFDRFSLIQPSYLHSRTRREISSTKIDQDSTEHINYLTVKYSINNTLYTLDLILNRELLSATYFEKHQQNGAHVIRNRTNTKDIELCHYKGVLRGVPESWAAISTCDNILRGVVYDGSELNYIEPLHYNVNASFNTQPNVHLVYKASDYLAHDKHRCGYSSSHDKTRMRRDTLTKHDTIRGPYNANAKSRYVELVLVVDNRLYNLLNKDTKHVYRHCKDIVNVINSLFEKLNIFVALVGVVVWTEYDEIAFNVNGDITLTNFLTYRRERLVKEHPNDNAQLLTAMTFENGVVGKALKGPICTYEFSGGINVDHNNVAGLVATTVAHEMGHNLGMEHDTAECMCPGDRCIMAPSSSSVSPTDWSSCSMEYLAFSFDHGMDYCMRNKPKALFDGPVCGNGFVEDGEECDCGLKDNCKNSCCNATTCTLRFNATCATGSCCNLETCTPYSAGRACRPADRECDLPEFCTGDNEFCPEDVFKLDGEACKGGEAFCYDGSCRTHSDQCRLLWGPSGTSSDKQCFGLNTSGNRRGNCGYNKMNQSYTKCHDNDTLCGMLHCQHLSEKLEFGIETVAMLSHSFINLGGAITPCRSAIVDMGLNQVDPGLSPDGARCGDGKLCVNRKCVSVATLRASMPVQSCPFNCHDQGVCNSRGNCHCHTGFAPPYCEYPGIGGSSDSGPASDPNESRIFITLFYALSVAVLPLSALILFLKYYTAHPKSFWWKRPGVSRQVPSKQAPPTSCNLSNASCNPSNARNKVNTNDVQNNTTNTYNNTSGINNSTKCTNNTQNNIHSSLENKIGNLVSTSGNQANTSHNHDKVMGNTGIKNVTLDIGSNIQHNRWGKSNTNGRSNDTLNSKANTQSTSDNTNSNYANTKSIVDNTRSNVDNTKSNVGNTNINVDNTKSNVDNTRSNVDNTKSNVDNTKSSFSKDSNRSCRWGNVSSQQSNTAVMGTFTSCSVPSVTSSTISRQPSCNVTCVPSNKMSSLNSTVSSALPLNVMSTVDTSKLSCNLTSLPSIKSSLTSVVSSNPSCLPPGQSSTPSSPVSSCKVGPVGSANANSFDSSTRAVTVESCNDKGTAQSDRWKSVRFLSPTRLVTRLSSLWDSAGDRKQDESERISGEQVDRKILISEPIIATTDQNKSRQGNGKSKLDISAPLAISPVVNKTYPPSSASTPITNKNGLNKNRSNAKDSNLTVTDGSSDTISIVVVPHELSRGNATGAENPRTEIPSGHIRALCSKFDANAEVNNPSSVTNVDNSTSKVNKDANIVKTDSQCVGKADTLDVRISIHEESDVPNYAIVNKIHKRDRVKENDVGSNKETLGKVWPNMRNAENNTKDVCVETADEHVYESVDLDVEPHSKVKSVLRNNSLNLVPKTNSKESMKSVTNVEENDTNGNVTNDANVYSSIDNESNVFAGNNVTNIYSSIDDNANLYSSIDNSEEYYSDSFDSGSDTESNGNYETVNYSNRVECQPGNGKIVRSGSTIASGDNDGHVFVSEEIHDVGVSMNSNIESKNNDTKKLIAKSNPISEKVNGNLNSLTERLTNVNLKSDVVLKSKFKGSNNDTESESKLESSRQAPPVPKNAPKTSGTNKHRSINSNAKKLNSQNGTSIVGRSKNGAPNNSISTTTGSSGSSRRNASLAKTGSSIDEIGKRGSLPKVNRDSLAESIVKADLVSTTNTRVKDYLKSGVWKETKK